MMCSKDRKTQIVIRTWDVELMRREGGYLTWDCGFGSSPVDSVICGLTFTAIHEGKCFKSNTSEYVQSNLIRMAFLQRNSVMEI